jgi:hypothetical protein
VSGPSDDHQPPGHGPAASDESAASPAAPEASTSPAILEPRQRWRLRFARDRPPDDEVPTGREYVARWESALLATNLPMLVLASGRPRVALGAPLPSGCSATGELLELWLTDIRPAWLVREALVRTLPAGHAVLDLENVWLGAPALSGQVAAADYDVSLAAADVTGDDLAAAAGRLLAAHRLPRQRQKGGGETKGYDLRPLLLDLDVAGPIVRLRTRIHPELGTGRPEEVVAALADELGRPLLVESIVRRRLLLADELRIGLAEDGAATLD